VAVVEAVLVQLVELPVLLLVELVVLDLPAQLQAHL
jgi:hypothetical protein